MEKMSFIDAHAACLGEFHRDGRRFVLISAPYTYAAKDEVTSYTADAICADDETDGKGFYPVYNVRWPVKDEHLLEYWAAMVAHDNQKAYEISMEWGVNEDTLDIEWDAPFAVGETMYKYNPEDASKRYEWD